MNTIKRLPLYIGAFSLLLAVACRKNKNGELPTVKTTEDYMRQMLGEYKMEGYSSYRDIYYDTVIELKEKWDIVSVSDATVSVNESTGISSVFKRISIDSARHMFTFIRRDQLRKTDELYYYYLADSLVYYGYTKYSMGYFEINLHSVN
jgi:hypothetical protein